MALEKRPSKRSKTGFVYRVRYPDPRTGRLLSATFEYEKDATDFDALWRVKKRGGRLDELDAGQQLLGDYLFDWLGVWSRDKSMKTLREATRIIDRNILAVTHNGNGDTQWGRHSIAWLQLRQVDARVVERWMHDLEDRGTGIETVRKALNILQQVMQRAVKYRDYPYGGNPVKDVDKPRAGTRRKPTLVAVDVVEKLRTIFLARGDLMSATLVSALAYAGLRPGEALALQVKHLQKGRLLVEQRNSIGQVVPGAKSPARRIRSVWLPKHLVDDLTSWIERKALRDDDPLFPHPVRGGYWSESMYRNWRRRTFKPAAKWAGFDHVSANPYTLRHVYVSLRYAAGDSPVEVASAAGHAPSLSTDYYAGVISAYERKGPIDIDAEIAAARARQKSAQTPN